MPAKRLQIISSSIILHKLILMLATIKFNYKLLFDTGEVSDVGPNGVLAPEPVCIHLFAAYGLP